MAELKTKPTDVNVEEYIQKIADPGQRADCAALSALMTKVTRAKPVLWGSSIIGFGVYHYVYASGREGDCPYVGFSPRKGNTTIYLMAGFARFPALMKRLGKWKGGKSCLYIKRLSDIDTTVLAELIKQSIACLKKASRPQKAKPKSR